jgi:choloylglycine hydrolase
MKLVILSILFLIALTRQCSDMTFSVEDGTVISARTMDFPVPMGTKLEIITIGVSYFSQSPSESINPFNWITQHGYVSFSVFGPNKTADGLNDCGLSCAALTLMETEYQDPFSNINKQVMGASTLCNYILAGFCSVVDVQESVSQLCVYQDELLPGLPTPLLHLSIRDRSGNDLVLEFIQGNQVYHDNLVGVLTNDPSYDWHIKNIQVYNYVGNIVPHGSITINKFTYDSFSYGYAVSNYGMSSDDSPVSRFVRAVMTIRFMHVPKNCDNAVFEGYNLLSKVSVIPGTTEVLDKKGGILVDKTIYKIIRDHTNLKIYYSTFYDPTIRMIDLNNINFNNAINSFESVFLVGLQNERIVNVTSSFLSKIEILVN